MEEPETEESDAGDHKGPMYWQRKHATYELYVEVSVISGAHLGECSGPSGHTVAMESSR